MGRLSSDRTDLEQRLGRLPAPVPNPRLRELLAAIPEREPVTMARPRPWRAALAFVSAVALLVAALLLLTNRGTPAFAAVEQALAGIETATWTETQNGYQPDGVTPTHTLRSTVWVRTNPPLLDRRYNTGQRLQMDGFSIRNYLPTFGQYSRVSRRQAVTRQKLTRRMIISEIVSPGTLTRPTLETGWKGREDRLNGQPVIRYTREFGRNSHDLPEPIRSLAPPFHTVDTVWVDEGSSRVLRSEHRQYDRKNGHLQYLTIADEYRYNATPPAGTFEWRLPRGVQEEDTSVREAWRSLPPAEKQAIQRTIDRFDAAFVAGDFAELARVWDFDYLSRFSRSRETGAERRRVWKIRVTNLHTYPKRKWQSWRTRVLSGLAMRALLKLGTLPPGSPEILELRATSHVTWTDGTSYEADCTYTLAKVNGEYHVVNWSYNIPHDVVFGD